VLVAYVGANATQLTSPSEVAECFRMVTDRAADVLGLGESYGIEAGRPASFVVHPAANPFDVIRRQTHPTHVVAHGRSIATSPDVATTLSWPGRPVEQIDFVRAQDRES